jgi:hypothetical protein
MSLMKKIMLDNIGEFYGENVFFFYPFENLSKWICIPNMGDHKKQLLHDCHNIPISSHPGFIKKKNICYSEELLFFG